MLLICVSDVVTVFNLLLENLKYIILSSSYAGVMERRGRGRKTNPVQPDRWGCSHKLAKGPGNHRLTAGLRCQGLKKHQVWKNG